MSKNIDDDITDEELEEFHLPFGENLHEYMIKYVIPEVVAFQIANSYHRGCLCDATYQQHYNSMSDIFNVSASADDIIKISDNIFELLKIKYHLVIVDDSPMRIEKRT